MVHQSHRFKFVSQIGRYNHKKMLNASCLTETHSQLLHLPSKNSISHPELFSSLLFPSSHALILMHMWSPDLWYICGLFPFTALYEFKVFQLFASNPSILTKDVWKKCESLWHKQTRSKDRIQSEGSGLGASCFWTKRSCSEQDVCLAFNNFTLGTMLYPSWALKYGNSLYYITHRFWWQFWGNLLVSCMGDLVLSNTLPRHKRRLNDMQYLSLVCKSTKERVCQLKS